MPPDFPESTAATMGVELLLEANDGPLLEPSEDVDTEVSSRGGGGCEKVSGVVSSAFCKAVGLTALAFLALGFVTLPSAILLLPDGQGHSEATQKVSIGGV